MNEEVQAALDRMMNGMPRPEDQQILQQALLRMAPSSPEYRQIVAVVGSAPKQTEGPIAASLPQKDRGGFWGDRPSLDALAGVGGFLEDHQPTADFMNPYPTVKGSPTPEFHTGDLSAPGDFPDLPRTVSIEPLGVAARMLANQKSNEAKAPTNAGQVTPPPTGNTPNTDVQGAKPLEGFPDVPNDVELAMTYDQDGGHSFSGINPQGVDLLYQDPETYLSRYVEKKPSGNATAGFLKPAYDTALALSNAGVLGQSNTGDIFGGATKFEGDQLKDIEGFLDAYNQAGVQVNPGVFLGQLLDRAVNTDWDNGINADTGMPYTGNDQIDLTNGTLIQVANMMPESGQKWLGSILLQAAQEYRNGVADGSINLAEMSYPEFLRQEKGLDSIMG